jgi:ADP-dependent NAD(P)H-hydrate dehydratase / NAD(P)H-hydrate epimerase
MYVLNAEEMRAADTHAIQDLGIPSLKLMENAATHVTEVLLSKHPQPKQALIICGKGNNGGDGLATSRLLKQKGWSPKVLLIGKASELKADPSENWNRANAAKVFCVEDPDGADLDQFIAECDLIVDALFGTGLTKSLEGVYSNAVQKINRSGKHVLSIDIPSGLSSDSGGLIGPAVKANITVALAALKYCHLLSPASKMCGEIYVMDIGIPVSSTTSIVRTEDILRVLPFRSVDSHKGTFGHAVIIAGSTGKSGAAYMAGKSALRCGAGLVTVICPPQVQPVIASLGPEIMTTSSGCKAEFFASDAADQALPFLVGKTAVAIGPGIGSDKETGLFFQRIVSEFTGPIVIDADGLNHLAKDKSILSARKQSSTILTPHPGEMSRLAGSETAEIQKDRVNAARSLSMETGAIVVLKGYRTVVATPDGKASIVLTGGQSLASAGTGDVLTGIITGFLAQSLKPSEAAMAGVYLHGLTANLFETKYPQQGLNAMDILQYWNEAVRVVRSGKDVEGEYLKIHISL